MKKLLILTLFNLLLSSQVLGQITKKEDVLLKQVRQNKDTALVNALNELSEHYLHFYLDPENGLLYGRKALDLAQKTRFRKGYIKSLINIGLSYFNQQEYQQTEVYLKKALKLSQKTQFPEGVILSLNGLITLRRDQSRYSEAYQFSSQALKAAKKYNNEALHGRVIFETGRVLYQQANYLKAAQYFHEASTKAEKSGDFAIQMLCLTNLAFIHDELKEHDKAFTYYFDSWNIHKKFAKSPSVMHLVNIGEAYYKKGDYQNAIYYTTQGYKVVENSKNVFAKAVCLGNLGDSYLKLRNYSKALSYYNRAMPIFKEINFKDGMLYVLIGYSELHYNLKQYSKAIEYALQSQQLAKQTGVRYRLLQSYQILFEVHKAANKYERALQYQSQYYALRDSLFNKETKNKIDLLQHSFELEKKQNQINLLAKEKQLQKAEINGRNIVAYFLLAGLSAVVLILLMLYKAYRNKLRTSIVLQKQNSEIREITEALKQTQQKLSSTLALGLAGTWTFDLQQKQFFPDESLAKMLDIPYNPMGMSFTQFIQSINPQDLVQDETLRTKAIINRAEYESEFRINFPDGSELWVFARGRAQYDTAGKPVTLSGVMIDITDKKDADRHKNEFLSIASHELRTPLTGIKGYFQLIERKLISNPETQQFLTKAANQLKRLERLTTDLMDVSRISSGNLQYEYSEFDFSSIINEAVDGMQLTAASHQIIVEQNVSVKCQGDKYRIEQVVNNLLSNAIKYSPQASKVIVCARLERDQVIVSIQDFGIGIPSEHIGRINERFYRVKSGEKYEGLGLGLYIASQILNKHEGKMWVESQLNKGSVFYFSLPVIQPEQSTFKVSESAEKTFSTEDSE